MTEFNMNEITGDTFEDMTIAEMMLIQGSAEIESRVSTPACFFASIVASIRTVQTLRGQC